jgi:type I restriction enzyme S subunit
MVYEGDRRLGEFFRSRREKGKSGLPTLSVTLTEGLVDRSSLDRKTDTALSSEEHLCVKKGDIAYNMMRMWQGASGLAEKDGLVSPAYVVLTPKSGIDSLYAAYLFKSHRMIYLFWAYSYGLTEDRLRLYFQDFARIPVTIPRLVEQRRTAAMLAAWDKAISKIEKLIDNNHVRMRALSQKLMSGKRRLKGFKKPWTSVALSELAEIRMSGVDKKSDENELPIRLCNYTDVYHNNVLTNDMQFMPATASQSEIRKCSLRKGDVVITKDSESPTDIAVPAFVCEALEGVVCGYHLAIIRPKPRRANGAFLSQLFRLPSVRYRFYTLASGGTRFGLSMKSIASTKVLVPDLQEQQKIAECMSGLEDEAQTLAALLEATQKQRRALMQRLLPGKRDLKLGTAA